MYVYVCMNDIYIYIYQVILGSEVDTWTKGMSMWRGLTKVEHNNNLDTSRCGSKNRHQWDTCLEEIGLHAQNMLIVLGSIVDRIGQTYMTA